MDIPENAVKYTLNASSYGGPDHESDKHTLFPNDRGWELEGDAKEFARDATDISFWVNYYTEDGELLK
jgi:hypothetical protein